MRTSTQTSNLEQVTFDIGERVPKDGVYTCVPCGYKKKLRAGDRFPKCLGCLKKERDEGKLYLKNLELWEFLGDVK